MQTTAGTAGAAFTDCFNHKALQEYLLSFLEFTFGFHRLCCVNRLFKQNFPLSVYGLLNTKDVVEKSTFNRKYIATKAGVRHGVFVQKSRETQVVYAFDDSKLVLDPNYIITSFYRLGNSHGDERFYYSPTSYREYFYCNGRSVYGWTVDEKFVYDGKMIYRHRYDSAFLHLFCAPLYDLQRSNNVKLIEAAPPDEI